MKIYIFYALIIATILQLAANYLKCVTICRENQKTWPRILLCGSEVAGDLGFLACIFILVSVLL